MLLKPLRTTRERRSLLIREITDEQRRSGWTFLKPKQAMERTEVNGSDAGTSPNDSEQSDTLFGLSGPRSHSNPFLFHPTSSNSRRILLLLPKITRKFRRRRILASIQPFQLYSPIDETITTHASSKGFSPTSLT